MKFSLRICDKSFIPFIPTRLRTHTKSLNFVIKIEVWSKSFPYRDFKIWFAEIFSICDDLILSSSTVNKNAPLPQVGSNTVFLQIFE